MVSDGVVTGVVLATFVLLFFRQVYVYPLTRAITATTGAVAVVVLGAVSAGQAVASVDSETILLLFGMLAHVEALSRSGFYSWAAAKLVDRTGTARRLTLGALWLAAALSAFALNDATVLLMTPILIEAVSETDTDPALPLVGVAVGANIGSVATPLGNPQNAYILSRSGLTTLGFVRVLGPIAVVSLVLATVMLGSRLDSTPVRSTVPVSDLDRYWAVSSGAFLLGTFVLLAVRPAASAGVIAASTGVVHLAWLQLFRRVPGDEILAEMDWGILVLFAGLFVLVESLEGTPLVAALQTVDGGVEIAGWTFLLSNLVSNVPAVVLLSTTVSDPTGWYLLAAVSTLAGNATPIASAATLILLDQASREDIEISAFRLIRVGFPIAVVTSGAAAAMLLV